MLLAAALISVAVVDPQSPAQPPLPAAPQAQAADRSAPQGAQAAQNTTRACAGTVRRVGDSSMSPDQLVYQVAVEARAVEPARHGEWYVVPPTWHEQFLAMTVPQAYGGQYYGATNGERLLGVASALVVVWGLQELGSWARVHAANRKAERKQKKVEKIRAEIRAELAELERVNAAARAAAHPSVTTTSARR